MNKISLDYKDEETKSSKVLFVITTDGYENASVEYTYEKINKMIKKGREKYNFEFLFLGANIDVKKEAKKLGIGEEKAMSFCASAVGIKRSYEILEEEIEIFRNN